MTKPTKAGELAALRRLALADVERAGEAELREEARDDGADFTELAERIRCSMREAAAGVLREQLARERTLAAEVQGRQPKPSTRPSLEDIKRAVSELFTREPKLRLAFRDGKQQSDWESLYDDLVALGALKPDASD